jgi:hypothetical protein
VRAPDEVKVERLYGDHHGIPVAPHAMGGLGGRFAGQPGGAADAGAPGYVDAFRDFEAEARRAGGGSGGGAGGAGGGGAGGACGEGAQPLRAIRRGACTGVPAARRPPTQQRAAWAAPRRSRPAHAPFPPPSRAAGGSGAAGGGLSDLFKPPERILFKGGFEAAKAAGGCLGARWKWGQRRSWDRQRGESGAEPAARGGVSCQSAAPFRSP